MTIYTNRRSLLKAAPAAAAMFAVPASAAVVSSDRSTWEAALRTMDRAKAEQEAYSANVFNPAYQAQEAFEKAHGLVHKLPDGTFSPGYWDRRSELQAEHGTDYCVSDEIHERLDALLDAQADAEMDVMSTPAPDLSALRWKIDRIMDGQHSGDPAGGSIAAWSGTFVGQMRADIVRLMPEGG